MVAAAGSGDSGGRLPRLGRYLCLLAGSLIPVGCAGLANRWQRNDVVAARQIAQRGMDALDARQWQRAESLFAEAVKVCPVDERVRWRYADALWRRGAWDEAIEHMREASRLSGDDPELLVRLGEMYLQRGELIQATDLADRVLRSGRETAAAYRLRGDVLDRQGHWREALASYHRAISMENPYPEVQIAIARLYYQHGQPQRALSTLQGLAAAYPRGEEPPEVLFWQGLAYRGLGRYENAVKHLAMAEARDPQSAQLLYHLAEARFLAGDMAAALRTVERAVEIDPGHKAAQRLKTSIWGAAQLASRAE
jgi:tetratricopeptide (TPR) repeat protein